MDNLTGLSYKFDKTVKMWYSEDTLDGMVPFKCSFCQRRQNTMSKTMFLSVLVAVTLALFGCGGNGPTADDDDDTDGGIDQPDDGKIHFSAAFAEVSAVSIYDQSGTLVASPQPDEGITLSAGDYLVDIRDEFGKGLFNEYANLVFVPGVTNAEIILEPNSVDGVETLLAQLRVHPDGSSPKYMGVSSPRGQVIWESNYAMYGKFQTGTYQYSDEFEEASFFPYLIDKSESWERLHQTEMYDHWMSCRHSIDEGDLSFAECYVKYGYEDPLPNFNEQDDSTDGVCDELGCCGGNSYHFALLVGYNAGLVKNVDGSYNIFPVISSSFPSTTVETVQAGDFLYWKGIFRIVVRVADAYIVFFGSNLASGGYGYERVGVNVVPNTLYGVYGHDTIECVYDGDCPQ